MNVWTGIALANLQRVRPPPLDVEADGGELFACKACARALPEDAYYVKTSAKGTFYRQVVCKRCVNARASAKRPKKPKAGRPWTALRDILARGPHTLRQIGDALGISTTLAQRMIVVLIADGEAGRGAPASNKYNPRVPTYMLKAGVTGGSP